MVATKAYLILEYGRVALSGSIVRGVVIRLPNEHSATCRFQLVSADSVGVAGVGYCRDCLWR
jgi:hypothetical protein